MNNQTSLWTVIIAGSIGAIFTLIITRVGIILDRLRIRNTKNFNALVRIEHLVNEWGQVVNDNRQNIDTLKGVMSKVGVLPLNRLNKTRIYPKVKLDLQDISLINKTMEAEYTLRRLNDDAAVINNHLDSFQSGVVGGNISPEQYAVLLQSMLADIYFLQAFMEDFLEELAELDAYVKLRLKIDETSSIKTLNWVSMLRKRKITEAEVAMEKTKVLEDIEKSRLKSIERRKKIESKAGDSGIRKNLPDNG